MRGSSVAWHPPPVNIREAKQIRPHRSPRQMGGSFPVRVWFIISTKGGDVVNLVVSERSHFCSASGGTSFG